MLQPRCTRRAWLATLGALAVPVARAQTAYPTRPVTLVVPNAAGGAADNLARSVAEELGRRLGQPLVVENLGGASGALAAQRVLRAPADGYTLLFGTTSDMVVTPIANRVAGYAARDFTAIGKVGVTPMTLVARPGLGVTTAEQLVALARSRPNGLTVGTTGNASLQAFATVALQRAAGVDLLGVPYKGGAPLTTDLLAGQIDLGVMTLPAALPHVRSGKLVMLGVMSAQRAAVAPDWPTLAETPAFKGVAVEIWAGLAGPPGLPAPVLDRLGRALQELLSDRDFNERRSRQGDIAVPFAPAADFARFVLAEDERYRSLASGLKLE